MELEAYGAAGGAHRAVAQHGKLAEEAVVVRVLQWACGRGRCGVRQGLGSKPAMRWPPGRRRAWEPAGAVCPSSRLA